MPFTVKQFFSCYLQESVLAFEGTTRIKPDTSKTTVSSCVSVLSASPSVNAAVVSPACVLPTTSVPLSQVSVLPFSKCFAYGRCKTDSLIENALGLSVIMFSYSFQRSIMLQA